MAYTSVGLRIHGARNARGQVIRFRQTTKDKITDVLDTTLPEAINRMREAMYARYNSPDASGRAARSLVGNVYAEDNGARVTISITNYREVKYLTTLVSDSEYKPGPYPIVAHNSRMTFFWKRIDRHVSLKQVMHPGFGPTDVLRESAETELSILGYLVEYTVRSAVAEVTSGGRILRVSGRQ